MDRCNFDEDTQEVAHGGAAKVVSHNASRPENYTRRLAIIISQPDFCWLTFTLAGNEPTR